MKKLLFACSFILFSNLFIKAQTSVGYTVDAYVDANSNFIHDGGETTFLTNGYNILPVQGQATCGGLWGTGTFYGNCPGGLFGGYVQSCNANNYVVNVYDVGSYIQPIPAVNNYTILGSTAIVTNVPLKPSILNQALMTSYSLQFKNTNNPTPTMWCYPKPGIVDTAFGTICNNSTINFQTFNNFMVYNLVNCNNIKMNLNFKIDGTTVDTYTFVGGAVNNYSTIPLANGSVQNWYAAVVPYMAGFSYSLTNYPAPSPGYHTFSIESVPVGMTYTATTVMKSYFYVSDCGQISGNSFVDCNNNCSKDFTEYYPGNNALAVMLTSAANTLIALPDANGDFTANAPNGTYTIVPNASIGYSLCGAPSYTTVVTTGSTYTLSVGLKEIAIPALDFSAYSSLSGAIPGPGAVPGGTVTINVYNNRYGSACAALPNPTKLKVVLPPLMTYGNIIGATPVPSAIVPAVTGDTIIWNSPAPNGLHQFTTITATAAVIGTQYCIKSIIYPLIDGDPSNNTYTQCRYYGGPFDPNEKTSEAPGMAANGDILPATPDLTYTLLFQNLGTGAAVNVTIKDTINANLNLATFQVISSSAPVQVQMNALTKTVDFKFANINLPPAVTNEAASHGYVRYKINLNAGLPLGTKIYNRGHIYFDYNSPVPTNKTVNTLVAPLGVYEIKTEGVINMYPNPTKNNITINSEENLRAVSVYNITGEQVLSYINLNTKTITIELQSFSKGLYFIKTETKDNKVVTKKIILE